MKSEYKSRIKPSDIIENAGLSDFEELEFITGQSRATLINWFKSTKKRQAFECIVLGAAVKKRHATSNDVDYWEWGKNRLIRKWIDNDEKLNLRLYKFALDCIKKFPNGIGSEHVLHRGSPRYIVQQIEKNNLDI